jgi:ATP-dependent Clp protease ATP-binding subunit ClpC
VQREIEDALAEKMLYGEVGPGQIVLVGVDGEGPTASFTFEGQKVGELPDLPPFETVSVDAPVEPAKGESGRGEGEDETPGPTDVEKSVD